MTTQNNKSKNKNTSLKQLLEDLTGETASIVPDEKYIEQKFIKGKSGIGYNQFNEILLSFGYDRITPDFFQFLVDKTNVIDAYSVLDSMEHLERGIEVFKALALFAYGNVKYAFKKLSTEPQTLDFLLEKVSPIEPSFYNFRKDQIQPVNEISLNDTYYLGHIIQNEIKEALDANPADEIALKEKEKSEKIIEKGIQNYHSYLVSDYIDVYVATSMREKHEYYLTNKWVNEIFQHTKLAPLKLRWFDPTQSYCPNRIDKGLFEALMLKRVKCTIYFVQENDTLGKDSELASTLAQGKPVIAFVPTITDKYVNDFLKMLEKLDTEKDIRKIILKQIRVFDPSLAWGNQEIQNWITNIDNMDLKRAKKLLKETMKIQYNKRSNLLSNLHPLGLQVNLRTGVANGVLVVRNIKDCVELVYRIVTRTLEFSLEEKIENGQKYLYLYEEISKCIYRVMTGDKKLTNSFWNYYLNEQII